jgi:hypothetical protein
MLVSVPLQRLVGLLAGIVIALCAALAPARADPALWVLKDADSTIYLFGTFHAIKPEMNWHNPMLDAAFAASSELWVEETGDDDQQLMSQLINRYGLDPKHPLFDKLPLAEQQKLLQASQRAHLDPAQVNDWRPWYAAVVLTVVPIIEAGYDPNAGVDHSLRAAAEAAGKPVHAFETAEQQLRIFADLPAAEELDGLKQSLLDIDRGPAVVNQLVSAWLAGDVGTIDAISSADLRQMSPNLYRSIFLSRNAAWTKRIEQILAGKGTVFIAVGAAHFAGPDSVIAMLARDGYQVTRE